MRYRPGYIPTKPLPAELRSLFSTPKLGPNRSFPRLRADALDRAVLRFLRGITLILLLPLILIATICAFLTARGTVRTLGRWFRDNH
jgi:hypothetical protein